jgi:tetratricopeptide (TPR) repeat protein
VIPTLIGDYADLNELFIPLDPNDSLYWSNKGIALERLGKRKQAIMFHGKAIEMDPNYAYAEREKEFNFEVKSLHTNLASAESRNAMPPHSSLSKCKNAI